MATPQQQQQQQPRQATAAAAAVAPAQKKTNPFQQATLPQALGLGKRPAQAGAVQPERKQRKGKGDWVREQFIKLSGAELERSGMKSASRCNHCCDSVLSDLNVHRQKEHLLNNKV